MIYTIVPCEQILKIDEKLSEISIVQAKYMGEDVILTQNESGDYLMSKLLSTNPQSFLKNEFLPGMSVDIKSIEFKNTKK